MYIITRKSDNVIIAISNIAEVNEEIRNIILDDYNIAYAPNEKPNIYQIAEIPEGVEIEKYCYIEDDGFYKNPDYIAPAQPVEEQITDLQLAVAELGEIIAGGIE